MTELALVLGMEPGTVWVGISSSDSRDFAAVRCALRRRGVALAFASESESAVVFDLAFECVRCGTPVGRISFGFSSSGEIVVGSAATQRRASATTQKNPARDQRFMGGKLAIKIQRAQAGVINLCRAGSVRFRSLPAH